MAFGNTGKSSDADNIRSKADTTFTEKTDFVEKMDFIRKTDITGKTGRQETSGVKADSSEAVKAEFTVTSYESSGNIIEIPEDKLVALLGVKDLVIVESGNAILVCHKDYAQKIKEATRQISDSPEYL